MSRLWSLPSTIAEYTFGTMIVLYQLSVSRSLARQRRLLEGEVASPERDDERDGARDRRRGRDRRDHN